MLLDPHSAWDGGTQENVDILVSERSAISELARSIRKELDPSAVPA
uniref:Uncharacterized protein n=1 Tax=Parascaris equorum TaxID=6256 RepID=A0A914RQ66_PAREQ